MEGPRSTTSSAPPASFQYQNLTAGVSDVTQTRGDCQYTSQLYAQYPLQFGKDLGIGDSLAGFIVL